MTPLSRALRETQRDDRAGPTVPSALAALAVLLAATVLVLLLG